MQTAEAQDVFSRHGSSACFNGVWNMFLDAWMKNRETTVLHCGGLRLAFIDFSLLHAVTVKRRGAVLTSVASPADQKSFYLCLMDERTASQAEIADKDTGSCTLHGREVIPVTDAHRLMTKFTSFGPKNNTSRLSDAKTITHLSEALYYKLYWHRWVFVIVGFW